MAVPLCSRLVSDCTIASPRSVTRLPASRKKKIATGFKAVAAVAHQRDEGDQHAVVAPAERLQAGPSSGTYLSQSRGAHRDTGSRALSGTRAPNAGTESQCGTAGRGHGTFLSSHRQLRGWSLSLL